MKRFIALGLWLSLTLWLGSVAQNAQPEISYERDIAPLLQAKCVACHNHTTRQGGLNVESYAALSNGGKRGVLFVAGKSDESLLIKYLDGTIKPQMPFGGTLSATELAAFKRWIDAGARGPTKGAVETSASVNPAAAKLPALKPVAEVNAAINSLAFHPNGKLLALGRYQQVELRDSNQLALQHTLGEHSGEVRGLSFSPAGKLLAATGGNPGQFGEIKLWDAATGKTIRTWRGHRDNITASAFAPDGLLLATCSYDKLIKLWDVASGAETKTLKDHTDAVLALAFAPDGKLLASAGADRTVKIWDVATGQRLYTLSEALDAVQTIAFSPDGKLLAGAGADRIIHLWQIGPTEGKRLRSLIAHDDAINVIAFSPNGKTLVTSGADKALKFWNPATLVETHEAERQPDWVFGMAFSPDGKTLAVGRYDGSLAVYDALTGKRLPGKR